MGRIEPQFANTRLIEVWADEEVCDANLKAKAAWSYLAPKQTNKYQNGLKWIEGLFDSKNQNYAPTERK